MNTNATLFLALSVVLGGCSATSASTAPVTRNASEVVAYSPPERALPPDAVDVSWEDNGVPIRPLSAPGSERELAQPVTSMKHRGSLSVAPPSNAEAFTAKKGVPAKK